jgi:hypothetical protein
MNGRTAAVSRSSWGRRLTPAKCGILLESIPSIASTAIAEAAHDAHASVCAWSAEECDTCRLRADRCHSVRRSVRIWDVVEWADETLYVSFGGG